MVYVALSDVLHAVKNQSLNIGSASTWFGQIIYSCTNNHDLSEMHEYFCCRICSWSLRFHYFGTC